MFFCSFKGGTVNLTLLMWVGGSGYLLNKIAFFALERSSSQQLKRRLRIFAWLAYMVGLPAWVFIFIQNDPPNWIAALSEAGGFPAMLMGLLIAIRGKGKSPKWLDHFSKMAIVLGVAVSWWDLGGIHTINQALEIGIILGYLVGTYLLAKQNHTGYLAFMVMNLCCLSLMFYQGYPILGIQQIISFFFVLGAFISNQRNRKATP